MIKSSGGCGAELTRFRMQKNVKEVLNKCSFCFCHFIDVRIVLLSNF